MRDFAQEVCRHYHFVKGQLGRLEDVLGQAIFRITSRVI